MSVIAEMKGPLHSRQLLAGFSGDDLGRNDID
jgi:hypothetical protein